MAETLIVRPVGAAPEEFSSLALAETELSSKSQGDWNTAEGYDVECYGGGNLGISTWAFPANPTEAFPLHIRAADGESPFIDRGTDRGMLISESYVRVSGLTMTGTTNWGYYIWGSAALQGVLIEDCTQNNSTIFIIHFLAAVDFDVTIRNTLLIGGNANGNIYGFSENAGGSVTLTVQNCTSVKGTYGIRVRQIAGAFNLNTHNTICAENATADFINSQGAPTFTAGGNLDSDGTADNVSPGGVGTPVNKTQDDPEEIFADYPGGDYITLKDSSPAVNAVDIGAELSAFFTTDILGNPRPSGAAFDAGCSELQQGYTIPLAHILENAS